MRKRRGSRFAYIEFASEDAVSNAKALEGSKLHDRPLKVRAPNARAPRPHVAPGDF